MRVLISYGSFFGSVEYMYVCSEEMWNTSIIISVIVARTKCFDVFHQKWALYNREYIWDRGKPRRGVAASPRLVGVAQGTEPHASEAAAIH